MFDCLFNSLVSSQTLCVFQTIAGLGVSHAT